jgi:hypothetical protein
MAGPPQERKPDGKMNGPPTFLGIPLRSWSSIESERRVVIIRIVTGVILAGIGFALFAIGVPRRPVGVLYVLAGILLMALAAACFATVLSRKSAIGISNLIYTDKHFDRSQPLYSRYESLTMQGRFEEAVEGFLQIAEEYPEEVTAWMHLLDIAFLKLKDPERAREFFTRGLSMMKDDESRMKLGRLYRSHMECVRSRELLDRHETASHESAPCDGFGEIEPEEDGPGTD